MWWWNKEVAEAVRYKKIKYRKWKKENTEELSLQQRKRNRMSGQMN